MKRLSIPARSPRMIASSWSPDRSQLHALEGAEAGFAAFVAGARIAVAPPHVFGRPGRFLAEALARVDQVLELLRPLLAAGEAFVAFALNLRGGEQADLAPLTTRSFTRVDGADLAAVATGRRVRSRCAL
jgi:hypothetical protein